MDGDLHITLTVARDDATLLPTIYLRDTVTLQDQAELERYHERLQAWLLRRPLPDETLPPLGFPVRGNPWRPEQLERILTRMDEWAPPLDEPAIYDQDKALDGEVRSRLATLNAPT